MKRKGRREEIQVEGQRVSVYIWEGSGRPLILLHGFMDSAEGFDNLARHSHRPCYAFDLPGFGRSKIADQASFSRYGEIITAAAREINPGPAIWVGHSMGGAVCRAVADNSENHHLIAAMALITPAGFGPLPVARIMDRPLLRPMLTATWPILSGNPLSMMLAYPTQVSGGMSPSGSMLARGMKSIIRGPQGPAMAAHALNQINHLPSSELLKPSSYEGPVASLWGSRDRLIPAHHSAGLKLVYPQAHITTWPDLAHHPQREQPRRLQSWIERHVQRSRRGH